MDSFPSFQGPHFSSPQMAVPFCCKFLTVHRLVAVSFGHIGNSGLLALSGAGPVHIVMIWRAVREWGGSKHCFGRVLLKQQRGPFCTEQVPWILRQMFQKH